MYYLYERYLKTGKERLIETFDTEEDAIKKMYACLKTDEHFNQLGEIYYFIKKR